MGPHLTQCGQGRGLPAGKSHLDPFNRLATTHQRLEETDRQVRTGQRCDSIGRTVLQTVAQNVKVQRLGKVTGNRKSIPIFTERIAEMTLKVT